MRRDRLSGSDPVAAAGDDQPHLPFDRAGLGEQALDLALECAAVEAELDRPGGALQPVEVVDQCEGLTLVEPDHLEGTVAAVEAVVLEADRRVRGRGDLPVDAGQLFDDCGHAGEALWSARWLAVFAVDSAAAAAEFAVDAALRRPADLVVAVPGEGLLSAD